MSIAAVSQENSIASGCSILVNELFSSSTPIRMIAAETSSPVMYSIRPCPNGCSVSGFCLDRWNPSIVIIELAASARLLNESAVIATDLAIVPAMYFPTNSSTFRKIPKPPHSTPYALRTAGDS